MYDIIIVGAGIAGLNIARLLDKSNKKICIIEKSKRIGGLIHSKYMSIIHKGKKKKIKIEAGGAVVYSYQKHMLELINKFNIEMSSLPIDSNKRHHKDFLDTERTNKPLTKKNVNKYFALLKKIFSYMDKKGTVYCRKFTLEQIALELIDFKDVRFIEFCYGYAAEFRVANSIVSRKNIENELFYSDKIYFFKGKGYIELIQAIYESFSSNVVLKKKCELHSFVEKSSNIQVHTSLGQLTCKQLIFAIPKQSLISLCDSFTKDELELLDSVQSVSLNRLFAQYNMSKAKNKWMEDINFSTVNNPIRQIIPIKKKMGLFQISYSDWYFADYWGSLHTKQSKKIIKKLLSEVFKKKQIDHPIVYKNYYWKDAIHYWKPNMNENRLKKKIEHLRKNIFIIGESYSKNQGWCEGAIQTSISVAKIINKMN
jgi:protoporphyrinogen oxidase